MNKRDKNPRPILGGLPCPKCRNQMQRWEHDPKWTPQRGRNYYLFWDRCEPCGFIRNYEQAKRQHTLWRP